jgi:hypothetical protein
MEPVGEMPTGFVAFGRVGASAKAQFILEP